VGLGGRTDPGRLDLGQPFLAHSISTHGTRPTAFLPHDVSTHGQPPIPPPTAFLLPSSSFVSSFSHFSLISLFFPHIIRDSHNQVVWFYCGIVYHAEVANDEWLAKKVFFVLPKYISYSHVYRG
jgi:hypothetical protein